MTVPGFQAQVMPPDQAGLLNDLGPWADARGYYLAGGTAVALWIGHRRSIDFDWFSSDPAVEPEHIAASLKESGHSFVVRTQSQHLVDGHIRGIRVTFVRYAYSTLEPPVRWQPVGCSIASRLDLSCMKLAAIAQRGSRKDFIDIHALLQSGPSLVELLVQYRRKYTLSDVMPVLRGLAYFDDAELEPMPEMLMPLDWSSLKSTLAAMTRQAFQQLYRWGSL